MSPMIVLKKVSRALHWYFDLNEAERKEFHELREIRERIEKREEEKEK